MLVPDQNTMLAGQDDQNHQEMLKPAKKGPMGMGGIRIAFDKPSPMNCNDRRFSISDSLSRAERHVNVQKPVQKRVNESILVKEIEEDEEIIPPPPTPKLRPIRAMPQQ